MNLTRVGLKLAGATERDRCIQACRFNLRGNFTYELGPRHGKIAQLTIGRIYKLIVAYERIKKKTANDHYAITAGRSTGTNLA